MAHDDIPWYQEVLTRLPAVLGGFAAGLRGQATPPQYFEPIKALEERKRIGRVYHDLEPFAEQYPSLKPFLPLLKDEPRLIGPFIEHAFQESQKVPLKTLPNWWYGAGYNAPVEQPRASVAAQPAPVPAGIRLPQTQRPAIYKPDLTPTEEGGTATLALPPTPEAQRQYADYQRAGERRVLPEPTGEGIAKARLTEVERLQLERERAKERRFEAAQRQLERLQLHAQTTADQTARQRETQLVALKGRYITKLGEVGASDEDVQAVINAPDENALNQAYTKAMGSTLVEVQDDQGRTIRMPASKAEAFKRTQLAERAAREKLEELPAAAKPVQDYIRTLERQRSDAERNFNTAAVATLDRMIYRARVSLLQWQHANVPRRAINVQDVEAHIQNMTPEQRLSYIASIKFHLITPTPQGYLLDGITPDELFGLEDRYAIPTRK